MHSTYPHEMFFENSIQAETFLCVDCHVFPIVLAAIKDVDDSLVTVEQTLTEWRLVL